MLIAEALMQRADLTRRIQEMTTRAAGATTMQEGDTPEEDPLSLIQQILDLHREVETLVVRINLTNAHTTLDYLNNLWTLTELIARRERYIQQRSTLQQIIRSLDISGIHRYSRSEIKTIALVSKSSLQAQADALSKEVREVDLVIQQANWSHPLL